MGTNALNWFEIPAEDMTRAMRFYGAILEAELSSMEVGNSTIAMLPYEQGVGVGGALSKTENFYPSDRGTLVYLNGGDDLNTILNRVEGAGGSVVMPKTNIGENGMIALFKDSEGNVIGLHSMG